MIVCRFGLDILPFFARHVTVPAEEAEMEGIPATRPTVSKIGIVHRDAALKGGPHVSSFVPWWLPTLLEGASTLAGIARTAAAYTPTRRR
jgi:hypothetical protein